MNFVQAKLYGSGPFLLAKILPDLVLLRIVPTLCFAVIVFEMLGLQEDTGYVHGDDGGDDDEDSSLMECHTEFSSWEFW